MTVDHLPEGMHQVSPHLICDGAAAAIDFYTEAFGATELMRLELPDGRLMHAAVAINGSSVMLVDQNEAAGMRSPLLLGGSPVTIHLIVDDAAGWADRAVGAGATLRMPVTEQFWGDRYGVVEDPFGHVWSIATPTGDVMPAEEMQAAAARVEGLG